MKDEILYIYVQTFYAFIERSAFEKSFSQILCRSLL